MARTPITGGGANSRVVTHAKSLKTAPKSRAMSPEAVGQQSASLAFARKSLEQGPGYTPGKMAAVDRPNYKGPANAGPGSNRVIYPSGLQSPTPPVREMAPSRDVFNERPNLRDRR